MSEDLNSLVTLEELKKEINKRELERFGSKDCTHVAAHKLPVTLVP